MIGPIVRRILRGLRRLLGIEPAALPPPKPPAPYKKTPPYKSTAKAGGFPPKPGISHSPPKPKPKKKKKKWFSPFDAGDLLELTPEELRAQAMKITPWRTAWIGRVDVIPPASDKRTALVDRGLELNGYLTREELDEIHEVGDLWLKYGKSVHDAKAKAHMKALGTVDAAIAKLREEEKARKAQKKKEAAERRAARAAAIADRRANDIVFLGRGVSGRLHDRGAHVEKLKEAGVPVLGTPKEVADAIGIDIPQLRWLSFHEEAARKTHYVQFSVPKRTGGTRVLSSPMPHLRKAQTFVRESILEKLTLHDAAHGFVGGRSTVTCAKPHQGRDVVVNLDLKDFFPSVTFPRVRGLFEMVGYSPAAATILALLCTESPRRRAVYDGTTYEVAIGDRALPQGACTSPALSNLVAKRLDSRLAGYAKKNGWVYTRYADDLTFSANGKQDLGRFLAKVRHIIEDEGFRVNAKKTRVQRSGGRQSVTGIVVNRSDRLTLPRKEVRRLRAILHRAKTEGLEAQNRHGIPDFRAHLQGKIAYLSMVDPRRGEQLRKAFDEVRS
ncbi:MAG: reverse transcriptase family protein [Myxococcota bacterium]